MLVLAARKLSLPATVFGAVLSKKLTENTFNLSYCEEIKQKYVFPKDQASNYPVLSMMKSKARTSYETFVRGSRCVLVFMKMVRAYKSIDTDDQSEWASVHQQCAQMILDLCKRNGGLFIKLGQHAAAMKSALPEEYTEALQVLQDKAPQRNLKKVIKCIRKELKIAKRDEVIGEDAVFKDFDPIAVGSASLAQVHRATLQDGTNVAVKVQHHGLHEVVKSDLKLVKLLENLASVLFKEQDFSLSWAVEEFEDNILFELDFREEVSNCTRIREIFLQDATFRDRVVIPKMYENLCTDTLIVMEFVEGIPLTEIESLKTHFCEDLVKYADLIVETFASMFFKYGFIHCDPHPGNLMISQDGKLILIDHGLYRSTSSHFRLHLRGIWRSMVSQDKTALKFHCTAIGLEKRWKLVPFILINRSMNTRGKLGRKSLMTSQENKRLLNELGLVDLSIARIGILFQQLSSDFLWVLRTMHLIKDLHRALGGNNRSRFLIYLRYAMSDLSFFQRFFYYIRLWLAELYLSFYQRRLSINAFTVDQSFSSAIRRNVGRKTGDRK